MSIFLSRSTLYHGDGRRLFVYGEHGPVAPLSAGDGAPSGLHLRHDALSDSWVGLSPARNTRPFTSSEPRAESPACPLCPGGPEVPFPYSAAVFENRWPSLVATPPTPPDLDQPTAPSLGRCEVVLYTSTHEGSIAQLRPEELAAVIAIWADRSAELWADPDIAHVMVFENRGEEVGATISHPHGQIYAFDRLPPLTRDRVETLQRHHAVHGDCLSCRVVAADEAATNRHVVANDSFTIAIPFAARWPYEVHVRARRHGARRLPDLTAAEQRDLAAALRSVVTAYDALYDRPLPYMMTVMEAPRVQGEPSEDWHLALEFLPPNRAPDKLKVRASVETATGFFINDTVPEQTASDLADALASAGGAPDHPVPDVVIQHVDTHGDATGAARARSPAGMGTNDPA